MKSKYFCDSDYCDAWMDYGHGCTDKLCSWGCDCYRGSLENLADDDDDVHEIWVNFREMCGPSGFSVWVSASVQSLECALLDISGNLDAFRA